MKVKTALSVLSIAGFFAASFAAAPGAAKTPEDMLRSNPEYFKLDPKSVTLELVGSKRLPVRGEPPVVAPYTPVDPNANTQYPQYPQYPYYPQYPQYPQQQQDGQQIDPATGQPVKKDETSAVLDTIDKIINLGEKVFGIIAKNKPVVDVTVNYANAVPKGLGHWTDLEGWKAPMAYTYSWYVKNIYQVKVVQLKYQVVFTYGGNYDGKGKFLTGVSVQPLSLNVAWGYTVAVKCEVPDSTIANVGTKENPIASMSMILFTSIDTILKHDEYRDVFYIQGDGQFKKTS